MMKASMKFWWIEQLSFHILLYCSSTDMIFVEQPND